MCLPPAEVVWIPNSTAGYFLPLANCYHSPNQSSRKAFPNGNSARQSSQKKNTYERRECESKNLQPTLKHTWFWDQTRSNVLTEVDVFLPKSRDFWSESITQFCKEVSSRSFPFSHRPNHDCITNKFYSTPTTRTPTKVNLFLWETNSRLSVHKFRLATVEKNSFKQHKAIKHPMQIQHLPW